LSAVAAGGAGHDGGHGNGSDQFVDDLLHLGTGQNIKVSPLEGLWWADDLSTFLTGQKSDWDWTMMIRQPDLVADDLVERLAAEVDVKKSLPAVQDIRLVIFEEGPAAQVLHVGPYAAEAPTIERLHAHIRGPRLRLRRTPPQAP
jgi:hypothetical protein